ncbi:MAG: hypothetical protein GXP31_04565 [Kiritimatiellaeota bacterium]|nr:hypothetical protein [Kiritimatiellota bacterium]
MTTTSIKRLTKRCPIESPAACRTPSLGALWPGSIYLYSFDVPQFVFVD